MVATYRSPPVDFWTYGMAGLAMILFIALFAFGGQYFGWSDPDGWVQLSLASAFLFGIVCGFRARG